MDRDRRGVEKDLTFLELLSECRFSSLELSPYIRHRLEHFSRDERKEIVSRKKYNRAPLMFACFNGNVKIVKYLIEKCEADIEQRGVLHVPYSRRTIASPLGCASLIGELHVVKFLVEHGANVNSVSDTGSTPVNAACSNMHYDVVHYLVEHNADILTPNYYGDTCLMNSVRCISVCKLLIENGADVNAQNIQLKTALHYAIKFDRFETMKLLLENGADPFIRNRHGDDILVTACLKGNIRIVDFLCDNYNYSKQRIAESHELLGCIFLDATIIDVDQNLRKCIHHWQLALSIRLSDPNNIIPKNFMYKPPYTDKSEFQTYEELETISRNLDDMYIQSLLVYERIFGPLHEENLFRLKFRGGLFADNLQFQLSINLLKYVLRVQLQKDSLLHRDVHFVAKTLVSTFTDFYRKHQTGKVQDQVLLTDIHDCIEMLLCHFENARYLLSIRPVFEKQQDNFDRMLETLVDLMGILYVLPKTPEQVTLMKQLISKFFQFDFRTSSGDTILHLIVYKPFIHLPTSFVDGSRDSLIASTVELFLKCGANVEVRNQNFKTPLQMATEIYNFKPEVIQVFLDYGAHIDRRDNDENFSQTLTDVLKIKPLQYVTLKCLAARKIMDEKIPFIGVVPVRLEEFIKIH